MIPDSITAWLRQFSKRHSLPHIHPHSFRHSAANILIHSETGCCYHLKAAGPREHRHHIEYLQLHPHGI